MLVVPGLLVAITLLLTIITWLVKKLTAYYLHFKKKKEKQSKTVSKV